MTLSPACGSSAFRHRSRQCKYITHGAGFEKFKSGVFCVQEENNEFSLQNQSPCETGAG